jgi:HCOMODA/2-hydroxy-3-carboxy-muconic semialdehyde decarboxylase
LANPLNEALRDLAVANRMCANEGVLDAFGHVSMRHPDNPSRYFLSRSRAPQLVEPADFIEYDLDSRPVRGPGATQYSERVIHGEIYKARPDVMSVCHHHAPAFMPLIATGTDYVPVFHLGAVGGIRPPFWDQHDEFGDTNMLVIKPEEGASLARALGDYPMVLMRRHGVTAVGVSVKDCVFRCIYSTRNAEYQSQALAVGGAVASLSRGEAELAAKINTSTTGLTRAWEYWWMRLERAGLMVTAAKAVSAAGKRTTKAPASKAAARKKPAAKKSRRR